VALRPSEYWTTTHLYVSPSLTLVATALFSHVISRSQVALNLAPQVTCDLAVRRRTPSLLPPTTVVSIVTKSFNKVSVACQVAISYMNIFTFFENLKERFKFWAIGCHVKGPLPSPLRTECQARTGGGGPWHGRSYVSSLGWQDFHGPGLIWPAFSDFFTLCRICQKVIIVGGKSWSKKYRENTSPGLQFFQIFFA
jgi:hypothetical protein